MLKPSSGLGPNSEPSVPGIRSSLWSSFLSSQFFKWDITVHYPCRKINRCKLGKELSFFNVIGSESTQHLSGPRCTSQQLGQHLDEGNPSLVRSNRDSLLLVLVGKSWRERVLFNNAANYPCFKMLALDLSAYFWIIYRGFGRLLWYIV